MPDKIAQSLSESLSVGMNTRSIIKHYHSAHHGLSHAITRSLDTLKSRRPPDLFHTLSGTSTSPSPSDSRASRQLASNRTMTVDRPRNLYTIRSAFLLTWAKEIRYIIGG